MPKELNAEESNEEDAAYESIRKLHEEQNVETTLVKGEDEEGDDGEAERKPESEANAQEGEGDEEDDEDLGYVSTEEHKAVLTREQERNKVLEEHGWAFKADGTPIPPPDGWKPKGVMVEETIDLGEAPVIPSSNKEWLNIRDKIKNVKPEEMRTATKPDGANPWEDIYKQQYPNVSTEFNELDDLALDRLREKFEATLDKSDNDARSENATFSQSIEKINSELSKIKEDKVFSRFPDAIDMVKATIVLAKESGMKPSEMAGRIEELKNLALGTYIRTNPDAFFSKVAESVKRKVESDAESLAAGRKLVGVQSDATSINNKGRYTPEVLNRAKETGMKPEEYAQYSVDKFEFV